MKSQILLNSSPSRSKTHPKPSQKLSKSTRNRAKRPLGPHLRPMLEKRAISNTKETFKKRLKVHKRQPRLSQTPPKWGPRPSQNRFLSDFLAFVFPFWICIVFSLSFYRLFVNFSKLEPLILSLLSRRNAIFYKIAVSKKMRKINPKTGPKPSQNLPKSFRNRQKIYKNRWKTPTWFEMRHETEKNEKNCEKVRKMSPKPSQEEGSHFPDGLREALPGSYLEFKKAITIY